VFKTQPNLVIATACPSGLLEVITPSLEYCTVLPAVCTGSAPQFTACGYALSTSANSGNKIPLVHYEVCLGLLIVYFRSRPSRQPQTILRLAFGACHPFSQETDAMILSSNIKTPHSVSDSPRILSSCICSALIRQHAGAAHVIAAMLPDRPWPITRFGRFFYLDIQTLSRRFPHSDDSTRYNVAV
jgi:hypothetical protein